ncbi:MAG: hypothetical protein Q9222_001453 [Ikaeria aurantiellina]
MSRETARNIPGFYYDAKRRKYFKITPSWHALSHGTEYSSSVVDGKIQQTKDLHRQEEHQRRKKRNLIRRSTVSALQEELGVSGPQIDRTTVWAQGIGKHNFIHWPQPSSNANPMQVQYFVHDPGTGAIILSASGSIHAGNSPIVYLPREDHDDLCDTVDGTPWVHAKSLGPCFHSEISSLSISPTRVVLATSLGTNGTQPSISLTRLLDPSIISENRYLALDDNIGSIIHPHGVNTVWASAAEPSSSRGTAFAVGTSKGVILAGLDAQTTTTSTQICNWTPDDDHSCTPDTTSVDFWSPDTILAGLRNGKVRIWDTRSNGTNTRFLHHPASCVNHVRTLDENKILVAGLRHSLCVYDARFTKPRPQSSFSPFPSSQPIFTFATYRNKDHAYPKLGLDVHRNLVAAGTDDRKVQIFDVRSGKELNAMTASIEEERRARWIKFVDDEEKGLQLLVANSAQIDRWAW